jgi:hypothetical protein
MEDKKEAIARRAHELWLARGCPNGSADRDWYEAERQLSEPMDESIAGSFPASDPPATRLPDEPPKNAPAKWDVARRRGRESDR